MFKHVTQGNVPTTNMVCRYIRSKDINTVIYCDLHLKYATRTYISVHITSLHTLPNINGRTQPWETYLIMFNQFTYPLTQCYVGTIHPESQKR